MVYIISGTIDSGKTSKMFEIYKQNKEGDGFISRKIYDKLNLTGYELVRLSTGDKIPFIFNKEYLPDNWDEIFSIGKYSFSRKGFSFAEDIIEEILQTENTLFIDEIGPLELNAKGFCGLFEKALNSKKDIYVCIREQCVPEVLNKFKITEYCFV